ncbi:MAG: hypothetical protein JKY94_11630 [Rhodobacteraceae bacterium]|nr:hypothetical protein [Paracoccaceae bacterium]
MSISFIGSTLSVIAAATSPEDQATYEANNYDEIGKVVSVGALGDTSEEITFDLLKTGRKSRVNGVLDLGAISVTIEYNRADAGQAIVRAANKPETAMMSQSRTTHTMKRSSLFSQGRVLAVSGLSYRRSVTIQKRE